ncbi:putative ribosomal protein s15 [Phaeomoniella chlamydospora]|uniref:Putative ribosomal protein s15 n=1 Tax=Phaeomoniella chlamydospora TaxID=158046 RepID=A0A0G2EH15_PHACM|nr:putative ribosomal protein s15 [Phaeomoniella chlamydospora]
MALPTSLPFRLGGASTNVLNHWSHTGLRAPATSVACFSTTVVLQMKRGGKKRKRIHRDPYREAQVARAKAANKARQEVLKKERAEQLGDPVRAKPTPFLDSLKQRIPSPSPYVQTLHRAAAAETETSESINESNPFPNYRNFFTNSAEVAEIADHAKYLAEPIESLKQTKDRNGVWTEAKAEAVFLERVDAWKQGDSNARIALERITSLHNASSKERRHMNIQRCIEEFGRHNTDETLPPRPQGPAQLATPPPEHTKLRIGRDTGSSEVQIAILTTKIEKLANHVEKVGHKDKHNKRNLRVLVHRRQKLLSYLRKKERGGPRWANLMEKLGLNDGAWKGEISL